MIKQKRLNMNQELINFFKSQQDTKVHNKIIFFHTVNEFQIIHDVESLNEFTDLINKYLTKTQKRFLLDREIHIDYVDFSETMYNRFKSVFHEKESRSVYDLLTYVVTCITK